MMFAALLSSQPLPALAATPISVTIDGQPLSFDQPPVSLNDRTMIPFRGIVEALGATVTWDQATGTIRATRSTDNLTLDMQLNNKTAHVNGQSVELDVPPAIVHDRTLVPVRFLAESLGAIVRWDQGLQQVQIRTDKPLYGRTMQDIRKRWSQLKPTFTGDPYLVKPVATSPQAPGKLQPGFLQDGINMMNFVRYLVGSPDDVVLDESWNETGQYGAVMESILGHLDHRPAKPAGLDDAFYQRAYSSSSQSNLDIDDTLADAVQDYAWDFGVSNETALGHRRWLFYPNIQKVGFGYYNRFSTLYVFDDSRTPRFDYDYFAWPSKGYHPRSFFHPDENWSVSIPSDTYNRIVDQDVSIDLTDKSTGKSWHFSEDSFHQSHGDLFFWTSWDLFGHAGILIFRPPTRDFPNGYGNDEFEVKVNGLQKADGTPHPIQYTVSFFDL